jgi:hypothetical protein
MCGFGRSLDTVWQVLGLKSNSSVTNSHKFILGVLPLFSFLQDAAGGETEKHCADKNLDKKGVG